jgi:hypothetical protein
MAKSKSVTGKFRITHMDEWDQSFVDAEIPGFILFDRNGRGEFQFGCVSGTMDCERTERNGKPAVEWSFEGHDDRDPISGRGWAVLQDDGTLAGKFSIHNGDSSAFTAEGDADRPPRKKPKRRVRATATKKKSTIVVDADKIRPGRIRQPSLPDALLKRIRAIHTAVKGVYDQPLEQMELNFMRDSDPEREVALWERIVAAMSHASAAMPELDRKMILKTLLAYSMGGLTKKELADVAVKRIIKIAEKV